MQVNTDEIKLVKSVLARERAAFEQLIRQYERLVLHIVTPITGYGADREDICQEVFLKVYSKLDTFRFESKLSTWIGNIAYHTALNFVRKRKNVLISHLYDGEDDHEQQLSDPADNAEELFIRKEVTASITSAIEKLSPLQQSMILLFHQDELSLEEIGKIIELPGNTIKSHLFRARKKLKEILTTRHTTI